MPTNQQTSVDSYNQHSTNI